MDKAAYFCLPSLQLSFKCGLSFDVVLLQSVLVVLDFLVVLCALNVEFGTEFLQLSQQVPAMLRIQPVRLNVNQCHSKAYNILPQFHH